MSLLQVIRAVRKPLALLCAACLVFAVVALAASGHVTDALAPLWLVLFPVLTGALLVLSFSQGGEHPLGFRALVPARAPPSRLFR